MVRVGGEEQATDKEDERKRGVERGGSPPPDLSLVIWSTVCSALLHGRQ